MWVRTLDDLVICRARAFYSIREQVEGIPRGIPHIKIRTSDDSLRVEKSTILRILKEELSTVTIISEFEPLLEARAGSILLRGKPDLYLVVSYRNIMRGLIVELHETDFYALKRTWHILPRLYVYALASHKRYGVTPISFSIPLSMSREFAVMCLANTTGSRTTNQARESPIRVPSISTLYSELNYISSLNEPPQPHFKSKAFCKECKYRTTCEVRR